MCPGEPYVTLYSESPTTVPSHAPTSLPTSNHQSESNKAKRGSDLILAIILPLVILAVVAIVGLIARAYFVTGKGELIPLSDESGSNLVFDT
jgi:lipopolysaccharide/colanic/teichoic acid biosynthesis glycosyltransferase